MSKVIVDEIQTDTTDGNVRIIPNGEGKLEVKGAGGDDAMIQLNCSAQTHGVKIKSPNHDAGQSYTMILPDNNIEAGKFLKVKSIASGSGATAVGQLEYADVAAGVTSDAQFNTVAGTNAGTNLTASGNNNTIIGYDAGSSGQAFDRNVLIGSNAGKLLTSSNNTVVGHGALSSATSATNHVTIGYNAGSNLTTADACIIIGQGAGDNITDNGEQVFIGKDSGSGVSTGRHNVAVGHETMIGTTGSGADFSVAVGYRALRYGGGGADENVAVGYNALEGESTADTARYNTGIGAYSMYQITEGEYNSGLGKNSGMSLTTGSNNCLLGYQAGAGQSPSGNITTGSNNVVLGNNSISNLYCADATISSSDSRDKTDVTSFTIGLNWIEALRPVTYRWDRRTWYGTDEEPYGTPDGSKKRQRLHIGFLAQEALEVEKANGYGNSNDDSLLINLTDDGMSYGMKYERLVPILVNAIKELSARVKTLEGG